MELVCICPMGPCVRPTSIHLSAVVSGLANRAFEELRFAFDPNHHVRNGNDPQLK